jgi:zinc protease
MKIRILAWLLALSPLAAPAAVPPNLEQAVKLNVEKYQLPNGMTVLLHPDSSIPAVSVHTWFRVGSKDELPGRSGLAHFFEHMMFKGTKRYGIDTWGKYLNGKGAETNAFTSNDYTGYFVNVPSEQLNLVLDIESDRMRNLLVDPKLVASEREVVKEERRMRYDDNIEGGIHEKMAALMYTQLPYKWLPIGSMDDLNAASMDDLRKFYKTYYSPNNAVLVIAGSFDAAATKAMIEKSYGRLPKEEIVRPRITPEPPQTAERRATIEREAQAPTVAIGYPLPDVKHPDHYALDLLSNLLGAGQSSRLYKQLVYKSEVALNAGCYSWGQHLGGRFAVQVGLKPGQAPDNILEMVEKEIAFLRNNTVSQRELNKARNMLMKEYVESLKKISGRARLLANYEVLFGDYNRIFSDLKEYQKITPADIKRVATLYLQPKSRNIIVVSPKKAAPAAGGKTS